jgi:hypothetical protein
MKVLALILAALSAVAGLIAAWQWWKASKVEFRPFEEVNGQLVEVPPTDVVVWVGAVRHTLRKSGRLNKIAAIWTAASVGLAGMSALAGALSN